MNRSALRSGGWRVIVLCALSVALTGCGRQVVAQGVVRAATPALSTATDAAGDGKTAGPGDEYVPPEVDADNPAVVARPVPDENAPVPTTAVPPPWAADTKVDAAGVRTAVGCAASRSAADLDRFFAERVGPVLGWDYQHVYSLGGERFLWIFQDTFLDHTNTLKTLDDARFVHNAALLQDGNCFELVYGGTPEQPTPFEPGNGTTTRGRWFWPMGGQMMSNGRLGVFWVEMVKDSFDPEPPDGLGWHPQTTFLAQYDPVTLERIQFDPAPNSTVTPIYGYAVESAGEFTYLFGNTFEQNLTREGGYWSGPHSATAMWLARVPNGQLTATPEYRTVDGWSPDPTAAHPISQRYYAENPMQPRFLGDQWVAATAVDGYWGDQLAIDVAHDPWGPWATVVFQPLTPRGNDPKMNTYHAHLLPWRDANGGVSVSVSNNARNMLADAWPHPERYRPEILSFPYTPVPVPTTPVPPTTVPPPTVPTTTTSTTTTTTTIPPLTPPTTPPPPTAPLPSTTAPRPTTTTRPPLVTTTLPPLTTTTRPPPPTTTTTTSPPTTTRPSTTTTTSSTTTTTVAAGS